MSATEEYLANNARYAETFAEDFRLGLDTDTHGALYDARGRPATDIVALGPPLRGRWYETTAIPEIRDQAAALARRLLTSQPHAHPGSAA